MRAPHFETLDIELDGRYALLQLARGEKGNAINFRMWADIRDAFEWLHQQSDIGAVSLYEAGAKIAKAHP